MFRPAKEFAAADTVLIAAPHRDLSFPAALKVYIEAVNVAGIAFRYSPEGLPIGLCKASRLYYISTAGDGPGLRLCRGHGKDLLGDSRRVLRPGRGARHRGRGRRGYSLSGGKKIGALPV